MPKIHAPCVAAAALATAGTVGGAYFAYQLYKNKRPALPEEWTEVGTLKELFVYPIKSCGPVMKNTAECTELGLKDGWLRDRVLMVTDDKNNFVTARVFPELLLVQPSLNGSVLTLKHPDMEDIQFNLAEVVALQIKKTATVWGISVPVFDCGFDLSNWFSRLLSKTDSKYRLVYYASHTSRSIRTEYTSNKLYRKWRKEDTGALPDEVPYHIINEASIVELNSRMEDKSVSHRNFRPNILIEGPKAFEEDSWNFIKVGDNIFEVIKPCTRCVMTTIDPETGIRDPNTQPLQMLKTYRQIQDPEERRAAGTSPRMGLQLALRSGPGGIINKGDKVYFA